MIDDGRGRDRPGGVTAIAAFDFTVGAALMALFALALASGTLNPAPLLLGAFYLVCGYGTWGGMPWAWYLLVFGGGFLALYFARDEVKEYFAAGEPDEGSSYTGD